MKRTFAIFIALTLTLGIPMVGADGHDDAPADEATWGLCQAYFASEPGNEASNGTVYDTPAFEDINASVCEDTEPPWAGTPGEDYAPDDPVRDRPGEDDNPGDDYP